MFEFKGKKVAFILFFAILLQYFISCTCHKTQYYASYVQPSTQQVSRTQWTNDNSNNGNWQSGSYVHLEWYKDGSNSGNGYVNPKVESAGRNEYQIVGIGNHSPIRFSVPDGSSSTVKLYMDSNNNIKTIKLWDSKTNAEYILPDNGNTNDNNNNKGKWQSEPYIQPSTQQVSRIEWYKDGSNSRNGYVNPKVESVGRNEYQIVGIGNHSPIRFSVPDGASPTVKLTMDSNNNIKTIKLWDRKTNAEYILQDNENTISTSTSSPITTANVLLEILNLFSSLATRKSSKKVCLRNIDEIVTQTSDTDYRILYGTTVPFPEVYPFMAALMIMETDDPGKYKHICGGILISLQFVVTAAHCFNDDSNLPTVVRLNRESTVFGQDISYQYVSIEKTIAHPWYRRSSNYHDIAVVKLKTSVETNIKVQPACLINQPISNLEKLKQAFLCATGWGATSLQGNPVSELRQTAKLEIVDKSDCSTYYEDKNRYEYGLNDSLICAVSPDEQKRSDACHGDSGGPLVLRSSNNPSATTGIIGIISHGQGCGSRVPSIYTSIYHYLDWIESVI